MLAVQLQAFNGCIMGLGQEEPSPLPPGAEPAVKRQRAERLARIRAHIPSALAAGGLTTLVFAAAFKVAQTQRAWTPALVLGGATALAGLARVLVAASIAAREREEAQATGFTGSR